MINLTRLKYFIAVNRHGSINKAARELRISQPSLTRNLRLLEDELGARLFDRSPKGVSLTESGHILAAHSRVLLAELNRLQESLALARSSTSGSVHIGLVPSVSLWIAPLLLDRCRELHPGIALHIVESSGETLRVLVANGKLDLAITQEMDGDASVLQKFVREENIVVAGNHTALRDASAPISWANLSKIPLVMTSGMSQFITQWAEEQSVSLNIHHVIDSVVGVLQIIGSSNFCSIMPSSTVNRMTITSGLRAIPLADPPITRRLVTIRGNSAVATAQSIAIERLTNNLLTLSED